MKQEKIAPEGREGSWPIDIHDFMEMEIA